ncbi:MAG: FAD-dependent oxidoreductase [Candidatus Paceibacterota bacterium]
MYELIIVGGGPAAISAGIVAARKKIKTLVIADSFGGQWIMAGDIQNFIGTKSVSGFNLAKNLESHLRDQEELEIKQIAVSKITKKDGGFSVETDKGEVFGSKTVLVASGSGHRKLNVPGEKELEGRGVFYCATCDAPLMKNKAVAVVGGGNSAFESAISLLEYASKVYILDRSKILKADEVNQEKVRNSGKAEIITGISITEILGDKAVSGLKYQSCEGGEMKELAVEGIFISISRMANNEIVSGLVETNQVGEIIVDPKTQRTSVDGIWAAGDVTDVLYKQGNIAMGDGMKAALNIYSYLRIENKN